jgi:hypothetical protein
MTRKERVHAAIDRAAKITDRRQALAGLQTLGRPIAAELRQSSRKEGERVGRS